MSGFSRSYNAYQYNILAFPVWHKRAFLLQQLQFCSTSFYNRMRVNVFWYMYRPWSNESAFSFQLDWTVGVECDVFLELRFWLPWLIPSSNSSLNCCIRISALSLPTSASIFTAMAEWSSFSQAQLCWRWFTPGSVSCLLPVVGAFHCPVSCFLGNCLHTNRFCLMCVHF